MSYTDNDRKFYFPNIIKKVTTAFMSLFTDIRIGKFDTDGTLINYRNVPVVFGQKQKFITSIKKSSQMDFSTYLPKIAVIITGLNPTSVKVQGSEIQQIFRNSINSEQFDAIYRPSAYTLDFTVTLISLHITEVNQILEQILPYFNPCKTLTIQEFDMIPSLTRDIKINLVNTVPNFMDDIDETDIRKISWDLNFTCDCFIYKPVLVSNIIKNVYTELLDMTTLTPSGNDLLATHTYSVSGSQDDYTVIEDGWVE